MDLHRESAVQLGERSAEVELWEAGVGQWEVEAQRYCQVVQAEGLYSLDPSRVNSWSPASAGWKC